MTRLLSLMFMCLVCAACGPLDDKADSTVSISTSLKMDACNAGYTRIAPNYCLNVGNGFVALTTTNVCFGLNGTGGLVVPSQATAVEIGVFPLFQSAAAILTRQMDVTWWADSGCTVVSGIGTTSFSSREWVALAAAAYDRRNHFRFIANTPLGNVWYKAQLVTACVGCTMNVTVLGYYD